jgi:hypothetical protein
MNTVKKNIVYSFLLSMFFVTSFFAARFPLLHEPLGFEDGIFAELIVNRPSGPYYSLLGRIEKEKIYGYISHPAALYELLRLGGWVGQKHLGSPIYLEDSLITPRLRVFCSAFQLIFWVQLLLFLFINRTGRYKWPILLLLTIMLSPLAIKASTHLQIDNTSGMLFCGTAALLFILSSKPDLKTGLRHLLLFSGGFVAGLGKHEWSIALAAALISTIILRKFLKNHISNEPLTNLCSIAAGLLLSNTASFLWDPVNYSRGFHFMLFFSKLAPSSAESWNFSHWLGLMKIRLPFLYVCLVLQVLIVYASVKNKKMSIIAYAIVLYGFFLFLGYNLSDHNYQVRYFAPCLAVLTTAAITMLPASLTAWHRRILIFSVSSVWLTTIVFLFGYTPNRNVQLEQINSGTIRSLPGTVLYLDDGAGWNKPDIDYINNNADYEITKQNIAQKYNKKLIRPEEIENCE